MYKKENSNYITVRLHSKMLITLNKVYLQNILSIKKYIKMLITGIFYI